MSAYADAAASVNSQSGLDRPWGMCAAPGCCLPGSLSSSTSGGHTWYCRLHFGAPLSEHGDITARISNRRELFAIALELTRKPVDKTRRSSIRDTIRAANRADLLKNNPQIAYAFGLHMLQVLGRECRAPQSHMGNPNRIAPSWVDASQPEEIDS